MESEKKLFYRIVKDGKIQYMMVDNRNKFKLMFLRDNLILYKKSKPCNLVLESKTLVALNPDVDRSYGFEYKYKIVPDPHKKFKKVPRHVQWINSDILIGEYITEIKSK